MTEPVKPVFDAEKAFGDLSAKFDGLLEAVKPKPDKSDRQILDEILEALKAKPESPTVDPVPPKPEPVVSEEKPKRKGNPFTRHHG